MKFTLLELTQTVLRSIKGEQVNSIGDTDESLICAEIIREAYNDIVASTDLPENDTLFELEASGDPTKPTLMYIPSHIYGVKTVTYDISTADNPEPNYVEIKYSPVDDFRKMINQFQTTDSNIGSFTVSYSNADSILWKYRKDKAPDWWTYVEDVGLIFDSLDLSVDTTLQKNKSTATGFKEPTWQMTDLFVPPLDSQQFNLLIQESKALAWFELRQLPHEKAEKKARRAWVLLDKKKDKGNYNQRLYYYTKLPDYGRNC